MEEAIFRNKAAVMAALAAAGITSVTVAFDGYGDEGQIESLEVQSGEVTVQLPVTSIVMVGADENGNPSSEREMPLNEAIANLCYEYLGEGYRGWETNEGSYCIFAFNVLDRFIDLDFTKRFVDEEKYSERF